MRPYSNDLRKRVIEVIKKGNLTKEKIQEQFDVSATFVYSLQKRYKETGSIEPQTHGGGMPAKFTGKDLEKLRIFVEKNPDATLNEILEHTSMDASIMAVSRALDRLGFVRKKNRYGHRSKIEKM